MSSVRERYGKAFWRAHHETWQQSELDQRKYGEAQGIPLKAFGNWRARFKAEPSRRRPSCRRHARVIGGSSARGASAGSLRKQRGLVPACQSGALPSDNLRQVAG
jgi:hypothetical protein